MKLVTDVNNTLMEGSIEPWFLFFSALNSLEDLNLPQFYKKFYGILRCAEDYLKNGLSSHLLEEYAGALYGVQKSEIEKFPRIIYEKGLPYSISKLPFGNFSGPKPIIPFINIFFETCKDGISFILSSSISDFLKPWINYFAPFGLKYPPIYSNAFTYNFFGEVSGIKIIVPPENKSQIFSHILDEFNIAPEEVVYFGDNEHDHNIFSLIKEGGGIAVLSPYTNKETKRFCERIGGVEYSRGDFTLIPEKGVYTPLKPGIYIPDDNETAVCLLLSALYPKKSQN